MRQTLPRLDSLTGLRFIAAAMIVFVHLKPENYPSLRFFQSVNLAQAVSFFFVLSGFILTYTYRRLENPDVSRFLIARFARLWPAHIFTALLAIILVPRRLTNAVHAAPLLIIPVLQVFMLHSWVPLLKFYSSFNSVSWSISTEFFFYLCFPFLSRLANRNLLKSIGIVATIITLLACMGQWLHFPAANKDNMNLVGLLYISPVCRILEFLAGIWTCRLFLSKTQATPATSVPLKGKATLIETMAFLLLMGLMFLSHWQPLLSKTESFSPPLSLLLHQYIITLPGFCLLIYVIAQQKGWLSAILGLAPLVFLGEISYALYLFHRPFLWKFPALPLPILWLALLVCSTSIYFLIEKPGRKLILELSKKRLPPKFSFHNVAIQKPNPPSSQPDIKPLQVEDRQHQPVKI